MDDEKYATWLRDTSGDCAKLAETLTSWQSLGCSTSAQYKSLALLFTVPEKYAGRPYTMRFYDGNLPIRARKVIVIPAAVLWGLGLGGIVLLAAIGAILVRRRKLKAQASVSAEEKSGVE